MLTKHFEKNGLAKMNSKYLSYENLFQKWHQIFINKTIRKLPVMLYSILRDYVLS